MTTAMTSSIAIECPCGRRGFIAARLAGRKVRCTGCGQPVRVPDSSSDISAAPAAERLELAVTPGAPARDASLDLLPEVTRTFHDPAALTRPRHVATVADEAPRRKRTTSGLRRDPDWERHLRGIAIWPMVFAVLGLALMAIAAALMLFSLTPVQGVLGLVLVGGAASAVQFAYGYFLWCYSETARLLHLIFSGAVTALGLIGLIMAPGILMKLLTLLELAWPAAIFAVLMDPRAATICTASYRTLVRRTPRVRVAWWTSPFFYLPIVLTAIFIVMIVAALGSVGMMMR